LKATKIRLRFTAPLHIAARGVGYERVGWIVNSDTLCSAILTVWSYLDAGAAREYAQAPPFRLSSAFPYLGKTEFYPKPLGAGAVDCPPGLEKKYGQVRFIAGEVFEKLLQGESVPFAPGQTRQNGRFWFGTPQAGDDEPILTEIETGRVVIDRVTQQGMNYYVSQLHFAEDAGLFFWVRFPRPEVRGEFFQVLRLLGEEGLGLDRNCGKGQFSLDEERVVDAELPGPGAAQRFLTLSLYHPRREEINAGITRASAYDLVQREGYISGYPYRRRSLTMFSEGSVFSGDPGKDYGDCREVLNPDFPQSAITYPVYRYGYAFPVGIG